MPNLTDKNISRELEKIFEECSSDGWDGERAKPVSKEVLRNSQTFLESLPSGVELPQIGAEPDGAISFEWYRSHEKVLSLSINSGGQFHYAAIVGARRRHGQGLISTDISDDLLALIGDVVGITPPLEQS